VSFYTGKIRPRWVAGLVLKMSGLMIFGFASMVVSGYVLEKLLDAPEWLVFSVVAGVMAMMLLVTVLLLERQFIRDFEDHHGLNNKSDATDSSGD